MRYEGLVGGGLAAVGAIAVAAVQPAAIAATEIADVSVRTVGDGVEVELVVSGSSRPQVFLLPPQGNSLIAHVADSTLSVPGGRINQSAPAPGIESVEVTQLQPGTVQVLVRGAGSRPVGRMRPSAGSNVLLSYSSAAPAAPQPVSQQPNVPTQVGQQPVLVPSPSVTIDGQPATLGQVTAPPMMPRAVAPPVGDIALSEIPIRPYTVQLANNTMIPRLVLREAPAREVLSLLARASGMNIVYVDDETGGSTSSPGGVSVAGAGTSTTAAGGADSRISVDIENEYAQDVFNTVLRTTGLQANRQGRTIFVGKRLPNAARDVVMRSIRVNQVSADRAAGFLVTMGAESASTATQRQTDVLQLQPQQSGSGATQGNIQAAPLTQTTVTERTVINELRYDPKDSVPILRGLQVAVDSRTNSLTLVGQRDVVALASEQLSRIDGRLRQVAFNVRVIDVDLSNIERMGSSFSFGLGGARVIQQGGIGIVNWADRGSPFFSADVTQDNVGNAPTSINVIGNNTFAFPGDFLAQLQATIVSGNAKILTDPTLIVQEGQTAQVELTEEVVGKITSSRERGTNGQADTITLEVEKEKAGLIMGVQVERIDDNGFVTVTVSPSLRRPLEQVERVVADQLIAVTLLAERKLASGRIRVRDGQTLVLSGIIQDSDRTTVRKIPILGDLPLIGSLFRRTERNNERKELIVLVTPQLIDDSNPSTVGYSYTPSREAQELIQRSNFR